MKNKFSSMGRVAIALVLALSLSVVMAAPVSATHTSSAIIAFKAGESTVVGEASILDVTVSQSEADNIKTVKIDFTDSDFTVTGAGTDPTGWTGSGPVAPAKVVTYTTTGDGIGAAVTFSPVVTNPATAGAADVPDVLTTDVAADVAATLDFSLYTGWIGYTAVTAGTAGDAITIEYKAQVGAFPLDVLVATNAITVKLAVDAEESLISTAAEVAAAINADAEAKLLVLAAVAVGKGTEVVPEMLVAKNLAGGIDSLVDYNCVESPLTLTVMAVPDVVWVDDDGSDANSGTEASPVATIAQGISIAPDYGTVNVLPGTYTPDATLSITQVGLTLQSTGDAAVTIIDASEAVTAIEITTTGVTVDGLTIETGGPGILIGAANATVQNNIFTTEVPWSRGITVSSTGATISGNELDINSTMYVEASDCTLSDNTFGAGINLCPNITDITITGNIIIGSEFEGICFDSRDTYTGDYTDILIEGNTISETTGDDAVGIFVRGENVDGLVIIGNDITDNGIGIKIAVITTSWDATNAINYNNITGNPVGIGNENDIIRVDAENNWWGTVVLAEIAAQAIKVDYTPWLTAEYGVEVTTIDLEVGWNFISVPKRMAAATDTFGELLTGITTQASYSYDPVGGWSLLLTDTPIEVLEGYWVDVTTAGTVTLSYKEAAQEVPASKSLVGDAWNAIGFSSTTALDANTALMSVDGSWSTVLGWDAEGQAYEDSIIVGTTGNMLPGKGYWIWMTEKDVLSAISG